MNDHPRDDTQQPTGRPIRLRSISDLIGAVPFLLSYVPQDAVVLVLLSENRIQLTVSVSFPPAAAVGSMAGDLNRVVRRARADRLLLIGYGPGTIDPTLTDLAAALERSVDHVIRVHDGRWWSLTCQDPACCRPGTPLAPTGDVLLALTVAQGAPAPSRPDLARQLAPASPDVLDQVAAALDADAGEGRSPRRLYAALAAARRARREHRSRLQPDQAAVLLRGLAHLTVRDSCVIWHDQAAVNLWLDLLAMAPPGWAAAPATLLALAVYRRGDGALANLAVDRALDDVPAYSLAVLTRDVIAAGIPPAEVIAAFRQASRILPDLGSTPGGGD